MPRRAERESCFVLEHSARENIPVNTKSSAAKPFAPRSNKNIAKSDVFFYLH